MSLNLIDDPWIPVILKDDSRRVIAPWQMAEERGAWVGQWTESDVSLVESVVAMFERKTPEVFAAQIAALLARPDATPTLRTVHVPTLVLCGRQDSWAPVAQHEAITALVPGARLVVVEDAGHMSPMERPQPVAQALLDWWRACVPAQALQAA